jgi:hypothetical protein
VEAALLSHQGQDLLSGPNTIKLFTSVIYKCS